MSGLNNYLRRFRGDRNRRVIGDLWACAKVSDLKKGNFMSSQNKHGERNTTRPVDRVVVRLASAEEAEGADEAIDRTLSDLLAQIKNGSETEDAYERGFNQ
jgi:hypothetical protein